MSKIAQKSKESQSRRKTIIAAATLAALSIVFAAILLFRPEVLFQPDELSRPDEFQPDGSLQTDELSRPDDLLQTDGLSRPGATKADADVIVNTSVTDGVSQLKLGITHTHAMWEDGHPEAVRNAIDLMKQVPTFHNQHIMGWGAENPQPSEGGPYDWSSLDPRINTLRMLGGEIIITFCTAPGWMKHSDDWDMDARVTDEHVRDFANLCKAVAQRYADVRYFQVWNEMKGYWNRSMNNWDYYKYTEMYNEVYNAVKSARPDAKIGGYYAVVQGDASCTLGYTGTDTDIPMQSRDIVSMRYWLDNKSGADFICIDRAIRDHHNPNVLSEADGLELTWTFEKVEQDVRRYTDLPIMWSEYYGIFGTTPSPPPAFQAALMASVYINMIKGDVGGKGIWGLLWTPEGGGDSPHHIFTDTADSSGGLPTPHYHVFKGMYDYFGPGTRLCQVFSSDPKIEALASASKTMLVNKYNSAKSVNLNGTIYELAGYEVKFVDIPKGGKAIPTPTPTSTPTPTPAPASLIPPAPGGIITVNDSVIGTGLYQYEFAGTWQTAADVNKYNGDDHYSSSTDSYYQVRFSGISIDVRGAKASHHGIMAVSIDGGEEQYVDCYSDTRADDVILWSSPVLTPGEHVLKVKVTGDRNASSSGYVISVDRVDITQ